MACDTDRDRGTAAVKALGVADAIKRKPRDFQDPGNKLFNQNPLVALNWLPRGEQPGPPAGQRWIDAASELGKVVHTGCDPGDAFVVKRAPLPGEGHRVSIGRDFVRLQPHQVLVLAIQHAHVRSEKFVRGADQEVTIERASVNWT